LQLENCPKYWSTIKFQKTVRTIESHNPFFYKSYSAIGEVVRFSLRLTRQPLQNTHSLITTTRSNAATPNFGGG